MRAVVEAGASLLEPFDACGLDSDDDLRGFDAVDPDFIVTAGELAIVPPVGAEDRDLELPVVVASPLPVAGATLILEFDSSSLTPFDPAEDGADLFTPAAGTSLAIVDGDRLVLSVWANEAGGTIADGAPDDLQTIGTLRFHIEDFAIVRPFVWADEHEVAGFTYRATIVDDAFGDHHPSAASGEHEFVRGNSNNDARVDLSDSVYTLNYLFIGGEEPNCLDAADSNNDSRVDISDGVYSLNFLFLGGPPIPPPYPACGLDEGPVDLLGCRDCSCGPYPQGHPCNP